jgi:hypothetical protein
VAGSVTEHANDASGAPVAEVSGVRMVDRATSGFDVLNAAGEVIAWCAHFEDALATQRDLDAGEDVRRVSDGAICAHKYRVRGPHFYAAIWNLKTEPEWQP